MIFNRNGKGSEELRTSTGSYYANADFDKIAGIIEQVQAETGRIIGTEVMSAIDKRYQAGESDDTIRAAQRVVGYMSAIRYFRLNDISHETDGRKVKMDSDNEKRPFEWQLERDDRMHMEEYYSALDELVYLLRENETFQKSDLYRSISKLCIKTAGVLAWVTGIEITPHLYLRLVPSLYEAQLYVEKRLGSSTQEIDDELLDYLAKAAIGRRAVALFVRKTEMKSLPGGAFREAINFGGFSVRSTTEMLHDYYNHMLQASEAYVHDMQHRRDEIAGGAVQHLVMPNNDAKNKYFIV